MSHPRKNCSCAKLPLVMLFLLLLIQMGFTVTVMCDSQVTSSVSPSLGSGALIGPDLIVPHRIQSVPFSSDPCCSLRLSILYTITTRLPWTTSAWFQNVSLARHSRNLLNEFKLLVWFMPDLIVAHQILKAPNKIDPCCTSSD